MNNDELVILRNEAEKQIKEATHKWTSLYTSNSSKKARSEFCGGLGQ